MHPTCDHVTAQHATPEASEQYEALTAPPPPAGVPTHSATRALARLAMDAGLKVSLCLVRLDKAEAGPVDKC